MNQIRVIGYVDENGHIVIDETIDLPPGEVAVIIEALTPEMIAADDALWDEQFAKSPHILSMLADEARAALRDGTAKDFDPDTDEF